MKLIVIVSSLIAMSFAAAAAQTPAPPTPPIAPPQDVAFPGEIKLAVDATDVARGIFHVRETIPVSPGPVTLLYPNWLPGNHAPRGGMHQLAGLVIRAKGERLEWTRDPVDMAAYHVVAPEGVKTLDIEFQFLSATERAAGRVVATPAMLNLQWWSVSLYPAGYYVSRIPIEASVTLPAGWRYGAALRPASTRGDTTTFKTVSYETLIDSPMFAGRYFKQVDLDPGARVPVYLNIVADQPELLEISPKALAAHRNLVAQADKLYTARHYDHYDFLLALTDEMGGIGLEHHRSSENGVKPEYFTEWDGDSNGRDLLGHEYTHSWNGKFRRPADLWTPNYDVPMRGSLLWVYEGQTQFWGNILSARSGMMPKQDVLDSLALTAAVYDESRGGRAWRAMQDTTNDPIIAARRALSWRSYQRSEDYYSEGMLIWLDVDTLIRERTGGAKSLDDFAAAFFGVEPGRWSPLTYTFDDIVGILNSVAPYDWAAYLRTRLDGHGPGAPLDWVGRSGYRLVYTDKPSAYYKGNEKRRKITDLTFSLGVVIDKDGELSEVRWEGPAFRAGLTTAAKIVAVNGIAYDADKLKTAIKEAAAPRTKPIELLVKTGDRYRTVAVDYHGGLRYPHLERVAAAPAMLDAILTAR